MKFNLHIRTLEILKLKNIIQEHVKNLRIKYIKNFLISVSFFIYPLRKHSLAIYFVPSDMQKGSLLGGIWLAVHKGSNKVSMVVEKELIEMQLNRAL
jgi:hypothetical protein